MKLNKRLAWLAVLAVAVGMLIPPGPAAVFAADSPTLTQTGGTTATQGDQVDVRVRVTNPNEESLTFTPALDLSGAAGSFARVNGGADSPVTLAGKASVELKFTLLVSAEANSKIWEFPLTLTVEGGSPVVFSAVVSVREKTILTPSPPDPTQPGIDLTHSLSPAPTIPAGGTTTLNLKINNRGNTILKETKVTLTLPDGLAIDNGSSTASAGMIFVGSDKTVSFRLIAGSDLADKNYPVTVTTQFFDSANVAGSISQTLYLPVSNPRNQTASEVVITGVTMPTGAPAGADFSLSFRIENQGKTETGQLKITAEAPDGIINKTQNTFILTGLKAGGSQNYTIGFFTDTTIASKNYPIKISVSALGGEKESVAAFQYAGIFITKAAGGDVKTPLLLVTNYSYGGTYVHAGAAFPLSVGLTNTSGNAIRNIKVTLTSDDGTFIPVKSSNTFFIEKINGKATVTKSIQLKAKPDAAQKTTALTVTTSYEDLSGNNFTGSDIITVPVMQDTRLVINEVVAPPELYPGSPTSIAVPFYNMGKTILSNLRVKVEGNFPVTDANSYYVGNFEPGKSDSYDLAITPDAPGQLSGRLIFIYEDAEGNEQRQEKEFSLTVIEMPPMPVDPNQPMEEPKTSKIWIPVVIGLAAVGGIGGFLWRRRRKRKINEELSIDE